MTSALASWQPLGKAVARLVDTASGAITVAGRDLTTLHRLVIADEPTSALDVAVQATILELISVETAGDAWLPDQLRRRATSSIDLLGFMIGRGLPKPNGGHDGDETG